MGDRYYDERDNRREDDRYYRENSNNYGRRYDDDRRDEQNERDQLRDLNSDFEQMRVQPRNQNQRQNHDVRNQGMGSSSYQRNGSSRTLQNTAFARRGDVTKYNGMTLEKKNNIAKSDLPYQQQEFVKRPERMVQQMKLGRKTMLSANFVRIKIPTEEILLHQYNVEVKAMTGRGERAENKREKSTPRFWECVKQHRHLFPAVQDMIYNDVNILWTKKQLHRAEFNLNLTRSDEKVVAKVEFKYAGPISFCANPKLEKDRMLLICLIDNIATARARCRADAEFDYKSFSAFGNAMFLIGDAAKSHQFGAPLTIPLGGGMEGWTGLHMAVKMNLLMGPVANIDLCHSAFYKPSYSLVRLLADVIKNRTLSDDEFDVWADSIQEYGMEHQHRRKLLDIIRGVNLKMNHSKGNRVFKVERLSNTSANNSYFNVGENQRISIAQYFLQKNIRLRFPNLPCVVGPRFNGQNGDSLFPLELVETWDEVQKFKGRLPESQLARLIQNTAYPPKKRQEILKNLTIQEGTERLPSLISSSDKWMTNYGVEFDTEFVKVDATVLPPPRLIYGDSAFLDEFHHGVWKSTDRDKFRKVLDSKCPRTNKRKILIGNVITVQNPCKAPQPFGIDQSKYKVLMNTVEEYGQSVLRDEHGNPRILYSNTYHSSMGINDLKKMMRDIKDHVAANYQDPERIAIPIVLFVFETRSTSLRNRIDIISDYGIIKQLCDCEIGIHCQGIMNKTLSTMTSSGTFCATAQNVAYKILSKVGTIHYMLEKNGGHKNWNRFTDENDPTLVLGVDVTHPGDVNRRKGGVDAQSVACVVGNIDVAMTKFQESSRVQQAGQETIVSMENEVKTRIVEFHNHTGLRPAHIVVYRDGVSETEFKRVLYEEKKSIEQACKALDPDYNPTITYIVVSKRHHTRFFPIHREDEEGEFQNLKPGTLVESGVTTKEFYDFYIASHFGAIGTTRPTHYYVLYDTWKPSDAFWPTITFALCYNYVRTTKSISVPAVVMYAHLAAKRAKDRLEAISNMHLIEKNRSIDLNQYTTLQKVNYEMMQHKDLDGMLFV